MAVRRKLLIHLFIDNVDDVRVDSIRTRIASFLAAEPDAKLLLFQDTEEETE